MSRIAMALSLALLAAAGCKNQNEQATLFEQEKNVSLKPIVAVVPIMDRTANNIPWNLSDELTSSIYRRLASDERLYLVNMQKTLAVLKKLGPGNNPFGADLAWIKRAFREDEFVAFLELLEHEEIPVNAQKASSLENCSAELNTSIRVRVFDLRGKEAKIVLQELIHDTNFIPRQFTQSNFYQVAWGKDGYEISPLGLAHEQLTKEISSRIEDYICNAMSCNV